MHGHAISASDKLLSDQFVVMMKAGPVTRALQEQIKAQLSLTFYDTVVDVVVRLQEDAEATMSVTKRHEPLHIREESLAPYPLSAMQNTIRELTQNMASMRQEMSTFKQELDHLKGKYLLQRDPDEDQKCWRVSCFGHVAKNCGQTKNNSTWRPPLT